VRGTRCVQSSTLALGAVLLLGASIPARSEAVLAIYPLQPLGVAQPTVDSLDSAMRAQASRLPGVRLIGRGQTDATLHASLTGPALSCSGEARCLSDIGRLLGADQIAYGVVSRLSNAYSVELVLIDVPRMADLRRIQVTLESGDRDRLLDDMRGATVQLVAPARYIAALQIETEVVGARVYLDGRYLASTPMNPPVTGLAPGVHQLRVAKPGSAPGPEGGKPFDQTVDLRFQRTLVVRADLASGQISGTSVHDGVEGVLAPAVEPPEGASASSSHTTVRTVGWVAAGSAVGLAALGLTAGLISQSNRNALAAQPRPIPPQDASTANTQLQRSHDYAVAANVLYVSAGVAAVTAVVCFAIAGFSDPAPPEPGKTAAAPSPRLQFWVNQNSSGLSLAGAF
jgi:hypothetical protein